MVQRARLLERERQRQLGLVTEREPARPVERALGSERNALECARAEILLDPALDLVDVNADRCQGLGVFTGSG
jgi:hypothetical protein